MFPSNLATLVVAFACFASTAVPTRADLLVKPHDVVAVCADMMSQQRMLSMDIESYLLMCQPVEGVRVVQAGSRDDGVEFFMKRLESDLAPFRPTVVLSSHGTGEGSNGADSRGLTFYHPTYQTQVLEGLKKIGVRTIVLGSARCVDSFYFHNNPQEAATWNNNLAAFRDSDRQTAEKAGVVFADIYEATINAMPKAKAIYGEKYIFGGLDGTNMTQNGQLIMAYSFLKALGCDGAIGTITVDLAANKAEGTSGHKILSVANGVVEVESTRYPFCFHGAPERPDATSGIIASFPFNDDLNRFLLIVKGLSGPKAKVTWGTQSCEFATADLEKGVNLAAAFAARTPFEAQFTKVENGIWAQQEPETIFFQSFFHGRDDFKKMAPGQATVLDDIGATIVEEDRTRNEAAAALVVPVRHTLKIEVVQ